MPPASAAASSMIKKELRGKCNLPANRLRVKKEGPTQGSLFYNCPAQVCNYFEWDPVELEKLQGTPKKEPEVSPELTKMMEEMEVAKKELQTREGSIKEREDSVLMMQQSLHEGVRNLVGTVVEQAEQRHQEVMESQHAQHVSQVEQLQNQLFWFTALAGETRAQEVIMNDLNKSQEVMLQAIQLRQRMMAAEPQFGGQDGWKDSPMNPNPMPPEEVRREDSGGERARSAEGCGILEERMPDLLLPQRRRGWEKGQMQFRMPCLLGE